MIVQFMFLVLEKFDITLCLQFIVCLWHLFKVFKLKNFVIYYSLSGATIV